MPRISLSETHMACFPGQVELRCCTQIFTGIQTPCPNTTVVVCDISSSLAHDKGKIVRTGGSAPLASPEWKVNIKLGGHAIPSPKGRLGAYPGHDAAGSHGRLTAQLLLSKDTRVTLTSTIRADTGLV